MMPFGDIRCVLVFPVSWCMLMIPSWSSFAVKLGSAFVYSILMLCSLVLVKIFWRRCDVGIVGMLGACANWFSFCCSCVISGILYCILYILRIWLLLSVGNCSIIGSLRNSDISVVKPCLESIDCGPPLMKM